MRATPDLIAPSLARSTNGSQYSLNNNALNSSLLSGGNLSTSGLNLHLLQQQLHQHKQQHSIIHLGNNNHSISLNPSLHELSSSCGINNISTNSNRQIGNLNDSTGSGAILGNRVDGSLINSVQQLPSLTNGGGLSTSAGSLPLPLGNNAGIASGEPDQLKGLLPAYRQAPDYNTAVQIKYGGSVVSVGDGSSEALYENQRKVSIDVS